MFIFSLKAELKALHGVGENLTSTVDGSPGKRPLEETGKLIAKNVGCFLRFNLMNGMSE